MTPVDRSPIPGTLLKKNFLCDGRKEPIPCRTGLIAKILHIFHQNVRLDITCNSVNRSIYVSKTTARNIIGNNPPKEREGLGAHFARVLHQMINESSHNTRGNGAATNMDPEQLYTQALVAEEMRDNQTAFRLYTTAAELGHTHAQHRLGCMHEQGRGVIRNYQAAAHYYQQAVKKNDPTALCDLGRLYENGLGVPQNYAEAAKYYQQASDLSDPIAPFYLGKLYENGRGIMQSDSIALHYYEKAAKNGNPEALFHLGNIYEEGRLRQSRDEANAVSLYKQAANEHFAPAQKALQRLQPETTTT